MYAGALDGRKGIVFAQLLTEYAEWCRVLELVVIETSQNQTVLTDFSESSRRNSRLDNRVS